MADQFEDWDRFMRHYTLTRNPAQALRWMRYEKWAEERAKPFKELEAELQLGKSLERLSRA